MSAQDFVTRAWYRGSAWTALLLPLAWLYGLVVVSRRWLYRSGWLASRRLPAPVIVIGNLTVGGTGKTPLAAAIATRLRDRGLRPGLVTRGYGRAGNDDVRRVTADSDPRQVGDEPVLLARLTGCPIVVGSRRVEAAELLLGLGADVIVSDDGLQHYALRRDLEIALIDTARGYGNGRLLPAGPLREPLGRLAEVDLALGQGPGGDVELVPGVARPVGGGSGSRPLDAFVGAPVHAVAGIGDPDRFFRMLRDLGLTVVPHPFPDHHPFRATEIEYGDDAPVLMTEKDAVKCRDFADERHWYVPVVAELAPATRTRLDDLLDRVLEKGI